MKEFLKQYKWEILIIVLAIVVRFYQLGTIPASLNEDETALGYNAYALLKTGADEHGAFLPLSLQSFGDWKLPFYPVTIIPFIVLFDLSELAVRLPSAIAGVAGVWLLIRICNKLFSEKSVGLYTGLFYALSPWNIFFSRMAYEANLAMTLFLAGLYCFLQFNEQKKHKQLLIIGAICWGLTLFTYHAFVIFTPLFFFAFIFLLRKKVFSNTFGVVACIIMLIFIGISAITSLQGSVGKLADFSIFNDKNVIYNRADLLRADNPKEPTVIKHVLFNKYAGVGYQVAQSYLASFSPTFLFDKGGQKTLHTLEVFGNMYVIDAVFIVLGLFLLLWRKEKAILLLAVWLVLSPIPSSITKDAPSTTRLVMLLPVLLMIAGYGISSAIGLLKKNSVLKYGLVCVVGILYTINVFYFLDIYFFHIDTLRGRYLHFGFKQMVELTEKYPQKKVVVRGPENFPYISFLFYTEYDPRKFQKEVTYYPQKPGDFQYVKSFGRYTFLHDIDYNHLKKNTIYVTDHITDNNPNLIHLPSGEPIFLYTITDEKTTH